MIMMMIVMMIMIKGSVVYMAGKGGYDGRRECEGNKGVRDK